MRFIHDDMISKLVEKEKKKKNHQAFKLMEILSLIYKLMEISTFSKWKFEKVNPIYSFQRSFLKCFFF